MSIEQKLLTKLQPHADRIAAGSGNDFDYLPAVLLQVVEGQKKQAQAVIEAATTVARKLDETEVSIASVKTTTEQVGAQSLRHLNLAFAANDKRLDAISLQQIDADQKLAATNGQLDSIFRQLGEEALKSTAMAASVAALDARFQMEHSKSHRLLIMTLVSTAVSICLAVVIVLRH